MVRSGSRPKNHPSAVCRRGRNLRKVGPESCFDYFELAYTEDMSNEASRTTTVLPPADLEAMLDLSRFLQHVPAPAALLGPDGQTVPLPIEAYEVLVKVVASMQAGKAITIAPVDQLLTTQEAANFLGISRPTLVKLLETGEIAFERPASGLHRRVRLHDVIAYQRSKRASRRAALDELTRDAADQGLYDEAPDYNAALRAARKKRVG